LIDRLSRRKLSFDYTISNDTYDNLQNFLKHNSILLFVIFLFSTIFNRKKCVVYI